MVPAVVFDCDGTLVDSEALHAKALHLALSGFGIELSPEEILRRSVGTANGDFLRAIAEEHGMTLPLDAECRVEDIALGLMDRMITPVAGAEQVVRRLAADGIRLALASNSSRRLVVEMLQSMGLASIFEGRIVTREDVSAPKPAPDIYRLAVSLLRVEAEECVAVEDSPAGIHAAHDAGLTVVGYRPRHSPFQDHQLIGAGATVVITDLRKVPHWLVRNA